MKTADEIELQITDHDRCDRCNARAVTVALMPSGRLLYFCQHHTDQYDKTLVGEGAILYDGKQYRHN